MLAECPKCHEPELDIKVSGEAECLACNYYEMHEPERKTSSALKEWTRDSYELWLTEKEIEDQRLLRAAYYRGMADGLRLSKIIDKTVATEIKPQAE